MVKSLLIKNYALIEHLEIDFNQGFSTITGETGAGKSILLGALSLILGERFDHQLMTDKDKKCIVEGQFIIQTPLKSIFEINDLDYEKISIFRREISPNGKSRAFVNDTPVNLKILKEISEKLIDIHSQHHTLKLKNKSFQLKLLDAFAGNQKNLISYKEKFDEYQNMINELETTKQQSEKAKADLDYFTFQFDQLENASLQNNELEELESELDVLTHAEDIKTVMFEINHLLAENENNLINQIKNLHQSVEKIKNHHQNSIELSERLNSIVIELNDIAQESRHYYESTDFDQKRIDEVNERLSVIYDLLKKHNLSSIAELITKKDEFEAKINNIASFDEKIQKLQIEFDNCKKNLQSLSDKISTKRKKAIPDIEKQLTGLLKQLGMQHAQIKVDIQSENKFTRTGKDQVNILFTANQSVQPNEISKIASGGELSRLMLAIKAIISETDHLPGMIFDEIDMGVSGDIADKMSVIMKNISKKNQVISITHLPQVASKGDEQFLVFKNTFNQQVETKIKKLNKKERILEIAKMLSSDKVTDAAINNARLLLGYE